MHGIIGNSGRARRILSEMADRIKSQKPILPTLSPKHIHPQHDKSQNKNYHRHEA